MAQKCKMRKIGIMAIPVFLTFFMFVLVGILGVSAASTIIVDKTSPACTTGDFYCDTIQEAVEMAKDGDTIIVCPGTYRENIVVDKPVSILSYGRASETVIEAKNNRKNIVIISANKVNISGFTIRNSKAEGIYLKFADNCNISGNNIYSTRKGIHLSLSNNSTISYNIVNLNGNSGIFLESSNDNLISNNTANSNKQYHGIELSSSNNNILIDNNASNNLLDGIVLSESSNNTIRGNTANSNKQSDGIELSSSNNNDIIDNNASNNLQDGIYLVDSSNNTIRGNTANSNIRYDGISLSSSNYNDIIDNNASNNMQDGIYLFDSSNNTIRGNTAKSNIQYHGIYLSSSNNNILIDNNASNNMQNGIRLSESSNNIIRGNNANLNKQYHGIRLSSSNNNILIDNNASNNMQNGIRLSESSNNIIRGNNANLNKQYHGIRLSSSNNNDIIDNNASNNMQSGISLSESSNNTIRGNIANLNKQFNGISCLSSSNNNILIDNNASNNLQDGIRLSESSNNTIRGNTAKSSKKGDGISLSSSNNNILLNNILLYNTDTAVILFSSDGNTITNNIIYLNSDGIYLEESQRNNISNNIINSNIGYGISLRDQSENNNIMNNIVSSNQGRGLVFSSSGKNNILNNSIDSNYGEGIILFNSTSITILGNTISSNYLGGIDIDDSSNFNKIYHNNIINNEVEDDSFNSWYDNSLKEGNYWSDYEGIDIDGDGIGDTDISYPGWDYDLYPLMDRDGWLTMSVWPHYLDFREVYQETTIKQNFTITNYGNSKLNISSIKSEPTIKISGIEFPTIIPRWSSQSFNITLNIENLEGFVLKNIEIISDDPGNPYKTISIFGFVEISTHDVRIEAIDFDSRVIKGQIDVFNVSISNHGYFDEHNISVNFKNGREFLGKVTIPVLLAGEAETVSYQWDTKDAASGVHEIAIEVRLPSKELLDSIKVKVYVLLPSEASTLIVTNFDRLSELWGENETAKLEDKLIKLSYNPCVNGIIIRVEEDKNCSDAYELWKSDLLSPEKANSIAREIKRVIESKLEVYRGVEYIILVGDDRVIPFYRITDNSKESYVGDPNWWRIEKQYVGESKLTGITTISSALQKNKYLTDDFYADFYPQDVPKGVELYIPDTPIGRLIETPEEIISTIDTFMGKESVYPNKIFITGYDFMNDSSWSCAHIFEKLKPSTMTVMSKGNKSSDTANYNNASDAVDELLKKRNDVIAIFQHAEHFQFEIPPGRIGKLKDYITSEKILHSSANLSGSIVYTMSCHAGLNVPPNETNSFDLAESFMNKGVLAYVSPTGYGMGGVVSVAGHERLLNYFTEYLRKGNDVGTALILAKQDYYLHNFHFDYIDEKVISSIVLYGLPMYRVKAEAGAEAKALEEDLQMDDEKKEQVGEVEIATLTLRPGKIAKDYLLSSGKPILPKAAWPYIITEKEMIHGITLKNARYKVEESAKVALETFTVSTSAPQLPGFETKNWYPSKFFKVNTIGDKQKMVIITGQYRPYSQVDYRKGDLRQFNELTFDIYISTPEKEKDPPEIGVKKESGDFIIKASDNESGVFKVIVAYTNTTKDSEEKRGEWKIKEYDGGGNSSCNFTFKLDEGVEFFVQAVDIYGNVAVDDNGGQYYPEKEGGLGT